MKSGLRGEYYHWFISFFSPLIFLPILKHKQVRLNKEVKLKAWPDAIATIGIHANFIGRYNQSGETLVHALH